MKIEDLPNIVELDNTFLKHDQRIVALEARLQLAKELLKGGLFSNDMIGGTGIRKQSEVDAFIAKLDSENL